MIYVNRLGYVAVTILLFSLLAFLGQYSWLLELFSHFRLQYLLVSGLLVVVFIIYKRRFFLSVVFCSVVINFAVVTMIHEDAIRSGSCQGLQKIKLLQLNLYSENERIDDIYKTVIDSKTDIVVLFEVVPRFKDIVSKLSNKYPFNKMIFRSDNFGIAILSKLQLQNVEELYYEEIPLIKSVVNMGDSNILLYATHFMPPILPSLAKVRSMQFTKVQKLININNFMPSIVVGDLNTTQFSPLFSKFIDDSKLYNSRPFSVLYSWPVIFPPLGLMVDHFLHTKGVLVEKKRSLPGVGSDHLPIVTTFCISN